MNTSGKHFQRMCAARKSTTGCYAGTGTANGTSNGTGSTTPSGSGSPEDNQTGANNLDDNVQTVSRRSRSRKVRGKRRNTIAGIDQKEIQDAANGYVEKRATAITLSLTLFLSLSHTQTVNNSYRVYYIFNLLILYTLHLYYLSVLHDHFPFCISL